MRPLLGGDLEYAVIAALWELGTASIRELHGRVGEPAGLAYTTVAKVIDRLHEKGLVARRARGKAFVYVARCSREEVDRSRARHAISRVLGEEPRPALANLVDAVESIDPALLDELHKLVSLRRRSRRGS
jgi:predicted transcriptional regulator